MPELELMADFSQTPLRAAILTPPKSMSPQCMTVLGSKDPASVASMAHGLIAIPLNDEGFSQPHY